MTILTAAIITCRGYKSIRNGQPCPSSTGPPMLKVYFTLGAEYYTAHQVVQWE